MPSSSCETQLLAPVLHTTQGKHALSDLMGVCMPHTFVHSLCLDVPLYVWTPQMFVCLSGSCETQLLAPVLHTTQRKHALSDLGGVFYAPIHLYTPGMFGHPLYVWMPLVCLETPICLYAPHMLPVHTQHKESMICQTKGVCMPQYICAPPCMLGYLSCVWMLPYVWMLTCMFGHPMYVWKPPYAWTGGIQTYRAVSKHTGGIQIYEGVQTWQASKYIGGIWTPSKSDNTHMPACKVGKHFTIQQNENPIKTPWTYGASKCMGVYEHGGIWTPPKSENAHMPSSKVGKHFMI